MELQHVLVRYCTYVASSSGVEQNFSQFVRIFGDQGLNMSERRELNRMKMAMDRHEDEVVAVLDMARANWVIHCGQHRASPLEPHIRQGIQVKDQVRATHVIKVEERAPGIKMEERAGAPGVKIGERAGTARMTEKRWLKMRRSAVSQVSRDAIVDGASPIAAPPGWSAKHQQEKLHQEKKLAAFRVESHQQGAALPEEIDAATIHRALLDKAAADAKNSKLRVAQHRKVVAEGIARKCLGADDFRAMRCYMEADCKSTDFVTKSAPCLMTQVTERTDADIFIARDITKLGTRSQMCAVGNGCFVVTPDVVLVGRGPQIKYKPAIVTERHIFMSSRFREKHIAIGPLLLRMVMLPKSRWKLYSDLAKFLKVFHTATRSNRGTYCVALVAKGFDEDPAGRVTEAADVSDSLI